MKRFILIGIALIAMFAADAGAVNYHPSDQLQTHLLTQQPTQVLFTSYDVQVTPAISPTEIVNTVLVTSFQFNKGCSPNPFAWIDPGSRINWKINLNYNITNLYTTINIPIPYIKTYQLYSHRQTYNVNYSYGLRD